METLSRGSRTAVVFCWRRVTVATFSAMPTRREQRAVSAATGNARRNRRLVRRRPWAAVVPKGVGV